ncbi:MAG TPA: sigma-54 dependent transcriptional regulator [Polyangia bacterium]
MDDEEIMLEACRRTLERHGLTVDTEQDPFVGRDRALAGSYELVLVDLRMPDLNGLDILATVREHRSDLEVIVITGYSSIDSAVQAVKLGAFDYLPKPFTPDELRARVDAALAHLRARAAAPADAAAPRRMVGDSPAMQEVYALIDRVAPTDTTVLVTGESGTGKELAAIELHAVSPRRDRPLVSLDCSALAPGLLESELFGHVKGSFTGAVATKPGLFEIADQGTLFLDEVASLSLETQGKLLRVLETGELKPVGGVEVKRIAIRLVAASNRDLGEMVQAKTFREDLFYRLNVVPIRIPPLRERRGDIPQLLAHFLGRFRAPAGAGARRLSPEALEALTQHDWPGNVRELKNLVERLVVTTDGEVIRLEHLPDYVVKRSAEPRPVVPRTNEELKAMKRSVRERLTGELERSFVIEALRRNDWNVTRAARETGLLRPNFHALMRKYRVRAPEE